MSDSVLTSLMLEQAGSFGGLAPSSQECSIDSSDYLIPTLRPTNVPCYRLFSLFCYPTSLAEPNLSANLIESWQNRPRLVGNAFFLICLE